MCQGLSSSSDISEEESTSKDPSAESGKEDVRVAPAHHHAHDVALCNAGKFQSFGITRKKKRKKEREEKVIGKWFVLLNTSDS